MRILIFFTLFLVFPRVSASQTFGGIGTRAEGMGGAFVAVADDATALYWNPAGLATGATFDFQVSGGLTPVPVPGSDPNGTNFFIGAAMPVLGIELLPHSYSSSAHLTDKTGDREGCRSVFSRPQTSGVTVVQTIVPNVVIGTTARLVRGGIEGFRSRTTARLRCWGHGAGGERPSRNHRPEPQSARVSKRRRGRSKMRRQVRAGAALAPRSLPSGVHGPFSLAIDADLVKTPSATGDVRMAAIGGEYWIGQGRLGARGGVRWNTLDTAHRAISGGLTLQVTALRVRGGSSDQAKEGMPKANGKSAYE